MRALRRRYGRAEAPAALGGRKIVASSFERYNGGIRIKRLYGSSTVTRFYVFFAEDRGDHHAACQKPVRRPAQRLAPKLGRHAQSQRSPHHGRHPRLSRPAQSRPECHTVASQRVCSLGPAVDAGLKVNHEPLPVNSLNSQRNRRANHQSTTG